jgi:hypothetical protein
MRLSPVRMLGGALAILAAMLSFAPEAFAQG